MATKVHRAGRAGPEVGESRGELSRVWPLRERSAGQPCVVGWHRSEQVVLNALGQCKIAGSVASVSVPSRDGCVSVRTSGQESAAASDVEGGRGRPPKVVEGQISAGGTADSGQWKGDVM